jgi:hypothetical protein
MNFIRSMLFRNKCILPSISPSDSQHVALPGRSQDRVR